MKSMMGKISAVIVLSMMIGACAQGRRSLAGGKQEEIWAPQSLCAVNGDESKRMGCFSLQLNYTQNVIFFDVQELGFDPENIPYRILGRQAGRSDYNLLADNVSIGVNGTIEVSPSAGAWAEDYEEFRIELTKGKNASGTSLVPIAPGAANALIVVQDQIYWTELDE